MALKQSDLKISASKPKWYVVMVLLRKCGRSSFVKICQKTHICMLYVNVISFYITHAWYTKYDKVMFAETSLFQADPVNGWIFNISKGHLKRVQMFI